jgi:hypothetical protein
MICIASLGENNACTVQFIAKTAYYEILKSKKKKEKLVELEVIEVLFNFN